MSGEAAISACALLMAGAITTVALSGESTLTARIVSCGRILDDCLGVTLGCSCPRRAGPAAVRAAFQAAGSGGIALGSWAWGYLANVTDVQTALLMSAGVTGFRGFGCACHASALSSKTPKCWPIQKFGLNFR